MAPAQGSHAQAGAGQTPRVAVIAVHGVGSPPQDSTAKGVAELLMQHAPDGVEYAWADERRVTIATNKVDTGDRERPGIADRLKRAFTRRALDRTNLDAGAPDSTVAFERTQECAERPDIAFTRTLLRGYRSERVPYGTVEIVGDRRRHGHLSAYVHVFEMHWADLTRLGTGFTRLIGALYQLVQHISQIGRKTIDIAAQVAEARTRLRDAAEARLAAAKGAGASPDVLARLEREVTDAAAAARSAGPRSAWAAYAGTHAWVIRVFTALVPVATLLMLAFATLFVPAAVKPEWRLAIGLTLAGLVLTIVVALLTYRFVDRKRAATLFVVYMLGIIGLTVLTGAGASDPIADGTRVLSQMVTLLAAAAYVLIVIRYDATRSGARNFGLTAALGVVVLALLKQAEYGGVTFGDPHSVRTFGFVGFQLSYALLMATWGVLWLAILIAVPCRLFLRWRADRTAVETVKRAVWTARVTLAGAVFGSIIALLVGYRSLVYLAARAAGRFDVFPAPLPGQEQLPVVQLPSLPGAWWCDAFATDGAWQCAEAFFIDLIGRSATSGFVIALLGLALVLALSSWFIVLIALTAMRPPNSSDGDSSRLGSWMTSGFAWLRRAGGVLAWTLLLAIATGIAIDYWPWFADRARAIPWTWLAFKLNTAWSAEVVEGLSLAVLASAATVGAARLRVEALATRARPAMGVVLDVDNYLREVPADATPRAKIAERFVSLLRYLERRGDFDRVVIVAHSQGTVITADLLRFLTLGLPEDSEDRRLVRPDRVRLLTMGSPLRQLYGANFPSLYGWVTASDPAPGASRAPLTAAQTPNISTRSPDPADLRVERWVNLYTSGDYIGRNLWSDDDWDGVWEPRAMAVVGGPRRERCLGSGTHTRYWDSASVAAELDASVAG